MNKILELEKLKKQLKNDESFFKLASNATQIVFGSGNINADILLIGEAPGRNEDESGEPFVGASGRILSEILQTANLSRDEVYITNIVKYRPPNNRDPSLKEKRNSLKYLYRQIEIIQPKIIMTLGRHSMSAFLNDGKISEVHGRVLEVQIGDTKYYYVPLFHPAVALYGASKKQTLLDDFSRALKVLAGK